jgi:hypothetical protein
LEDRGLKEHRLKSRWSPRRLSKLEAQYALLDRLIKVLDTKVREKREAEAPDPVIDRVRALMEREEQITRTPMTFFYKDGFEKHAAQIKDQIVEKGFCTKA